MADADAVITEVDPAVVERVADAMEVSAADPQHRARVDAYLYDLALAGGARVLEVGCGTGAIAGRSQASREGDGRDLPLPDRVRRAGGAPCCPTSRSPSGFLVEASRVLRGAGRSGPELPAPPDGGARRPRGG